MVARRLVVGVATVAALAAAVGLLVAVPVPVRGGLTYACINCDNIPPRLWTECESATNKEMPCYPYRLVKNTLCKRTCRAVHRKPCRLKARICRADPDCAHLCRKFFEYLCPLTEAVGLKEDPNNICPGYDAPPHSAGPNPLLMTETNATARWRDEERSDAGMSEREHMNGEWQTPEEEAVEELMRDAMPGAELMDQSAVMDEAAQRQWYERREEHGADD